MRGTGFDNNVGWNAVHFVGLKVSHQLIKCGCHELHIIVAVGTISPAVAVEAGIAAIGTLPTTVGRVGALVFSDRC